MGEKFIPSISSGSLKIHKEYKKGIFKNKKHPFAHLNLNKSKKDIFTKKPNGTIIKPNGVRIYPNGYEVDKETYQLILSLIDQNKFKINEDQIDAIAMALIVYEKDNLKKWAKEGVKIIIAGDEKNLPKDWLKAKVGSNEYEPAIAFHRKSKIYIRKDCINLYATMLHELAHLFQYKLNNNIELYKQKHPKLEKFFASYIKRCEEAEKTKTQGVKWSVYARQNNSWEYFAEAMAWYYSSAEYRDILKNADPKMYNYIEKKEYLNDD